MNLRATLLDGEREIGDIAIVRLTPDNPELGDLCRYAWKVTLDAAAPTSSNELGPVEYRYGPGAWTLVAAVLDKAGYGAPQ